MGNKVTRFHELSPEVEDAWRNSNFTLDEITLWYDDFRKRNPTGQVNVEDFKKIYNELFAGCNTDDFATFVFRLYDVDGNGYLSFRELMCGLSLTSLQNPVERIKWVFKLYDQDLDGFITRNEMVAVLQAVFKMNPNPTLNLSLKLPLGTNEVTPEKITERIFEKYDRDNDGKLSQEDLFLSIQDPLLTKILA